jgi:hypothetical protein
LSRHALQADIDEAKRAEHRARSAAAPRYELEHVERNARAKHVGTMNVTPQARATKECIIADLVRLCATDPDMHIAKLGGLRDGSGGTNVAMVSNMISGKTICIKCDGAGNATTTAVEAFLAAKRG